ncbi:MAG: hypothetical protein OXN15_02275, partial [Chloroflexota bacterium]|nr:hypothetical protein [Chloroflexota bacterium]
MPRVRLLHLRPLEAAERISALHALGYDVLFDPLDDRESLKRVWQMPPDAYVFDITRVPSHMRELAISLRERKTTRHVPMVFAGGDAAKVARLREALPDAAYARWDDVGGALAEAIAHPPESPVVPESQFAGYSGTPLPKKLGVKPGMTVNLLGAPDGFERTLGPLPEGAVLDWDASAPTPLAVWFVRSMAELEAGLARAMDAVEQRGGLWMAWPKRSSDIATDVTQQAVREAGLAAGLVDYKVA